MRCFLRPRRSWSLASRGDADGPGSAMPESPLQGHSCPPPWRRISSKPGVAAATGLGGIGKTQLACEFVYRYGRFFAGGVSWMSFADATNVPTEIADCGRSLGLPPGFDASTLEQQVRMVKEVWQGPLPRLL